MSSSQNMQHALFQFGFQSFSFATNYKQLTKLEMPVIVYLEHRKGGHFSVLRGISASTVWLADPSLGNRTYSRLQFLAMWDTRTGEQENAGLKGRVFAVLPVEPGSAAQTDFFTTTPRRQTAQAIAQIRLWNAQ